MKDSPYNSILNFKTEQKEYALLCKGKSKKYKLYTDWEEHIIECISKFKDEKDLYNFKRYCLNRERTSSKMPEMFATYIGLLITIYLDRLIDGLPLLVWLLFFVGIVFLYVYLNYNTIKGVCTKLKNFFFNKKKN